MSIKPWSNQQIIMEEYMLRLRRQAQSPIRASNKHPDWPITLSPEDVVDAVEQWSPSRHESVFTNPRWRLTKEEKAASLRELWRAVRGSKTPPEGWLPELYGPWPSDGKISFAEFAAALKEQKPVKPRRKSYEESGYEKGGAVGIKNKRKNR